MIRDAIESIEYKGHTIHVVPDIDAENPFESWDSKPPLVAAFDHHDVREYGVDLDLPELPREVVAKHYRDILRIINDEVGRFYSLDWHGLRAFTRDEYIGCYPLDEILVDALTDVVSYMYPADAMETLAEIYGWLGIHVLHTSIRGYTQGAYADVLLVATPEWIKRTGAPEGSIREQLEAASRLYAAWAFGDTYGYVITRPCGACGNDEEVDSCWGYYGADHEESGLMERACNAVDCLAREAA